MSQFISHSEWEHIFTDEALTVEELLSSGDFLLLEQSKIRIALDNKILDWEKFKSWITEKTQCASIKNQLGPVEIQVLKNKIHENKKTFSHFGIWSDDLIPLETWDHSLIVLGLYPPESLMTVTNYIFVLCPPEILKILTDSKSYLKEFELEVQNNEFSESVSRLELEELTSLPENLNFSKLKSNLEQKNELSETSFSLWNIIDSNHNSSCTLARKQFDAYLVLQIIDGQTRLFKMDEDLEKEDLNISLFHYDLNLENVFSNVYKSGTTESFDLETLGLSILDFKFACISPLKLGAQTLGFIVGFKIEKTTQQDVTALDLISQQSVA